MRKTGIRLAIGAATAALVATAIQTPALSAPSSDERPSKAREHAKDDLSHPLGDQARAERQAAVDALLKGKANLETRGNSQVVRVAKDKYVEFRREATDQIFTILSDFADFSHGQIPEPDRAVDNTTYWTASFDREHYLDMFFGSGESMADFYAEQSSGRYSVDGDVSDWVTVSGDAKTYGDNATEAAGYQAYVTDTIEAYYNAQVAAGKTDAEIASDLARFDQWDRYDHDGDGDFNESDGYIDHFQAIHAGEGEEAGGGVLGADAIWSHRWYVNYQGIGSEGPADAPFGGVQIGNTGLWVGDYTTEPENGGLGVFAHEFGHDLGLPDLYDTAGGDNGTGFWTIMSAGSWLGHGEDSIGTTPGFMGAWEKLQLGWLDYSVVKAGTTDRVTLGPAAKTTRGAEQAVVVTMPDKTVTEEWTKPYAGSYEWWSGSADGLNVSLSRSIAIPAGATASIAAKAWYDIEAGYDFVYPEVSTDGSTWTQLDAIDGDSGGAWADLSYDLSAYAGQTVQFRFRYQTDGGVHYDGAFLDEVAVTINGTSTVYGAESADEGWTTNGWVRTTGTETKIAPHYYLVENRQYVGYDDSLRTGPYNFGHLITKPNWVEHFPYQDGMLVWYADGQYTDNNTSSHPGGGQVLPVDARPAPIVFDDGARLGNRRQPFDATFGLQATDPVVFYREVASKGKVKVKEYEEKVDSQPPIAVFDDSNTDAYWTSANPWASTKVAGFGLQIEVLSQDGTTMDIEVRPAG